MQTKKIEQPMRLYLDSLKVRGRKILSDDTMNYLTAPGSQCAAYEFKQEGENDHEFLRLFSTWLHEYPQIGGHTEYYLLMGMRLGERLTDEEFEFLERNVAECFASSHGWVLRNKPPYAFSPQHHTHHKSAQGIQTTNQERTALELWGQR